MLLRSYLTAAEKAKDFGIQEFLKKALRELIFLRYLKRSVVIRRMFLVKRKDGGSIGYKGRHARAYAFLVTDALQSELFGNVEGFQPLTAKTGICWHKMTNSSAAALYTYRYVTATKRLFERAKVGGWVMVKSTDDIAYLSDQEFSDVYVEDKEHPCSRQNSAACAFRATATKVLDGRVIVKEDKVEDAHVFDWNSHIVAAKRNDGHWYKALKITPAVLAHVKFSGMHVHPAGASWSLFADPAPVVYCSGKGQVLDLNPGEWLIFQIDKSLTIVRVMSDEHFSKIFTLAGTADSEKTVSPAKMPVDMELKALTSRLETISKTLDTLAERQRAHASA